ncbi:MAG TPA: hypothetical protein VGG57_03990 [Stellaceae bacterium]|jgi:hypothetical protein
MIKRLATALSALILGVTPALADPFNINISNGESAMLLLTVNDMNYPSPKVAYSGSINSGQMISVYINGENGSGGHIQWSATSADRTKCGSGDVGSLGSGNNLTVNTPSSC